MDDYKIIVEQEHQTVMAHYEVEPKPAEGYQSEAKLENSLIQQLRGQGYEYAKIKNEVELLANLRHQLEALNNVKLSDTEWARLLPMISNEQMTIQDKTEMIQGKGYILNLTLDNGTTKNIKLIDKTNVYNNRLQVINQFEEEGGTYKNRYDVTILVNGLPMVHIELKRRGVEIKEAFNQINRYLRDSFWAGRAMFDFVQIFVISNGTETKYYSNTTRYNKEREADNGQRKHKTAGNTFEFTSYWTDQENTLLTDLRDFTQTFFAKHTILNILTKYCVFNVDKQLLVMRPYQIAATEKILQRIQTAINMRWQGTIKAGGYIWHTTGSGKTLTSFKTAQLASRMEGIKKVLFVVDRKDLDYQTMKEYDNFEPNCANGNSSSRILLQQLKDDNVSIIITTIQKLSNLMKPKFDDDEKLKEVLTKDNIVLIFDECHRSQFGDMRQQIARKFKRYFMFGFTGTPIFAINAHKGSKYSTTAQLFGGEPDEHGKPTKALHTYTIINAIRDKNVLRFHIDYESTMKMKSEVDSKMVWGIDTDEALHNPKRISLVTSYIIDRFAEKTKQGKMNSIFAVDSVKSAILYYNEFMKQLAEPDAPKLKVATIYTYAANEPEEDEWGLGEDENPEGVGELDLQSRDALEKAIGDYNRMWTPNTNFSTDGERFQSYYKDVSLRMKNKQIDILIVVGMFLTGFDAKTLNTLWVDKNLKMHGLLQAYSRTNRILNAVKNCGNIVCFRNLEEATNKSLAIFGDENASGLVFMKSFDEYYSEGYDDEKGQHHDPYVALIKQLLDQFPVEGIANIFDEEDKKRFIRLFGEILRLRNILSAFDEFTEDKMLVSMMTFNDYLGWYNTLHDEFRPTTHDTAESIMDDIVFEMELVKQVQVNIHYILMLVQKYHDSNCKDKEIIVKIKKEIEASPDMRDKRDLIMKFIDQMTPGKGSDDIGSDWEDYIEEQKQKQLQAIIDDEHLKPAETTEFMARAFMDGYVTETGTGIAKILPPTNPFLPDSGEKKQTVIDKLKAYFNRFCNLLSDDRLEYDYYRTQKLENAEDDEELREMISTLLHMNPNMSDMAIQREVTERFAGKYAGMSLNDWRHMIADYTTWVREAIKKEGKDNYLMAAEPIE